GPHGMVYTVPSLWDRAHHNDRTGQSPIEVETDTKFDAFHLTTPVHMRVKNTPMVLTVHDTIPFSLPGSTTENLDKLRVRFQSALDAASLVATVSEHTRSDVLSLFDVDPDKVMNTYQPVLMQPLSPEEQAGLGARLAKAGPGLSAQGYLLFVGAIEPKKNLGRLVEAYRKVDPDLPLVVVGRLGWMYDDVVAAMKAAGTKVIHLPYVDRSVLRDVIAGARAMFFPSLYEGFGLPVIEAMVLGTPVVTSNTTSLGEVAGEAALTVDPLSVDAIAEALDAIVTSEAECARLSEAGQTRAQEFSMGRYQERLKALYDRL
ncbi:MAG: glycosyltransferase family 4 protein, partial [Rhodospirillaceae bacterium]